MSINEYKQIRESIDYSRRKLQPFREQRMHALRSYVGFHYSDSGSGDKIPVNLLEMAVSIYKRQLAAQTPRVLVTSKIEQLKPTALSFEIVLNKLLEEIDFGQTLQNWVTDALFSVGILKIGICPDDSKKAKLQGWMRDPGSVFAETVDLDDFVIDMSARKWDQAQYIGNRYSLLYDQVKDSDMFGDQTKNITPQTIPSTNEQGDERTQTLSAGFDRSQASAGQRTVELWDIWMPFQGKYITFQADDEGSIREDMILRETEWDGPEQGPYQMLSFGDVPGNVMPLSPIANLIDLHDLANRMFRKMGRQAERQKTLTVVQGGADEDGQRVVRANDGDTIRSDRPEATREVKYGGVDSPSLAFLIQIKDMFSYFGGNLDVMGGLAKGADTLGQERLLKQSSAMKVVDMQERTTKAVKQAIKTMAYWVYNDPVSEYPIEKTVEGTDVSIETSFPPELRKADIVDYELDIAPYSMQDRSPAERVQTMMQVMSEVVLPMSPMLAQYGMQPDLEKFMHYLSKYSNTPELDDILGLMTDEDKKMAMEMSQGETKQSPVTTRNYVRENRSGATQKGKDDVMSRILMGGNVQQSEMDNFTPDGA